MLHTHSKIFQLIKIPLQFIYKHIPYFSIVAIIVQRFVKSAYIQAFVSHSHRSLLLVVKIASQLWFWSHYRQRYFDLHDVALGKGINNSQWELTRPIRDHRWPTCSEFFLNISPTTRENMTIFCNILTILNVPIDRNNFFVNFFWTFIFYLINVWWNILHIWHDSELINPIRISAKWNRFTV